MTRPQRTRDQDDAAAEDSATATRSSPALQERVQLANVMQVPGLTKIVVNMGVGEAARDSKLIEGAVRDLAAITGQKPQVTKARKSIAQFKLREGMPIGAHVTLRGDRMWEFLDRLLTLALPRIRDFRGLSPEAVRRPRQLHLRPDRAGRCSTRSTRTRIDRRPRHGHHRRDHRQERRRGPRAAAAARLPLQGEVRDGEESTDRQGRPASRSSRCAATPAASAAAGRRRSTASSACAGSACARWRTAASCPASPSPAGRPSPTTVPHHAAGRTRYRRRNHGEKGPHGHDDDRPDRRHADASAQRQPGVPRHRRRCRTARSRRASPRSSSRRATSPPGGGGAPRRAGRQDPGRSTSSTARTGSARSPASAGSPSPACGCTRRRPACPRCSADSASRSSRLQGLLTDRQAKKKGVGGEVLAYVW